MKINNFEKFTENVTNLSINRKWKTFNYGNKNQESSDFYFTYSLKKSELGKYLNTWFKGIFAKSKDSKYIYRDEIITLKKVDKETARHLYDREYNPISIIIMCPTGAKFKQDENGNNLYEMKAQIHSVDDSSYGIWWTYYDGSEATLKKLEDTRNQLMKWINAHSIINGEEFLDICVSLGAGEDSKDYN